MPGLPIQPSLSVQHSLQSNLLSLDNAMNKVATGLRINRGADDPAGLIGSESLRTQLAALEAEAHTLQRTDMKATVADGYLAEQSSLLSEAKAIEVQLANRSALSNAEVRALQDQLNAKLTTIDRLGHTAGFLGERLFDGQTTLTAAGQLYELGSVSLEDLGAAQITSSGQTLHVDLADLQTGGVLEGDVANREAVLDRAVRDLAMKRGELGAFQHNTIQARLNTVNQEIVNTASAESQIRDTDYAAETAELARARLLGQTTIAALDVTLDQQARLIDLLAG